MTCLVAGALILTLSAPVFSLNWAHSVEKTEWAEVWAVLPDGLRLESAAVKGSGAGMEPGPGARLADGWWVWKPALQVPALKLAASGATGAGWRLCDGAICHEIGAQAGEALTIAPCGT